MRTVRLRGRFKKGFRIKRSVGRLGAFKTTHRKKSTRSTNKSGLRKKLRVTAESNLQGLGNKHKKKPSRI